MGLCLYRVSEDANLLHLDLDHVARFHEDFRVAAEADAARRAGGDDVAGPEKIELRVVLDELRHREHQIVGVRRLHPLAVQPGLDVDVVRIWQLVLGRDARPHRAEGREHLAEQVVLPRMDRSHHAGGREDRRHPIARRDVVDQRIARDVVERLGRLDRVAQFADDDAELAFPVEHAWIRLRHLDRLAGRDDARHAFGERRGLRRHRRLHLLQVLVVVHADREHHARIGNRREQLHRLARMARTGGFARALERTAREDLLEAAAELDDRFALQAPGAGAAIDFESDELHAASFKCAPKSFDRRAQSLRSAAAAGWLAFASSWSRPMSVTVAAASPFPCSTGDDTAESPGITLESTKANRVLRARSTARVKASRSTASRRASAASASLVTVAGRKATKIAPVAEREIGSTEPSARLVTNGVGPRCQCTTVWPRFVHTPSSAV